MEQLNNPNRIKLTKENLGKYIDELYHNRPDLGRQVKIWLLDTKEEVNNISHKSMKEDF